MSASVWALLRKEIDQHRTTFYGLVAFSAIVIWLLIRLATRGDQFLSYLSLTSIFVGPVLVIIAFILGQRLIVQEQYAGTARFIEALPIRRGHAEWVKFSVGLLGLLLLTGGVWLTCLMLAKSEEPITTRFVVIMAARLSAYVFVLWSLVFTVSLLGRLRIVLIASAALAVSLINTHTSFELSRFGPLALVDRTIFAFERTELPVQSLIESVVLGIVLLALGMVLARMRDGSVVESLATPVSTREKGFLIILAVATVGVYSYFGPEPEEKPFAFTDSFVITKNRVDIAYLDPNFEADATTLVDYLSERTVALEQRLPWPSPEFAVRVSLAPVADATEFNTDLSSATQGVVVNANFENTNGWHTEFFGAYVVHQILSAVSNGRFMLEPQHWLLDGFSQWWAERRDTATPSLEGWADPLMVEALYATESQPISPTMLRHWDATADQLGDTMAMSVAYSGWRILQEMQGTDAVLKLAQQEFRRPTHGDVRDWVSDWRTPAPERFARATRVPWSEFVELWSQRLDELRTLPIYRQALEAIPRGELVITTHVRDAGTRVVYYRLSLDRSLPTASKCVALHTQLPSFDTPVPRGGLREAPVFWPAESPTDSALSVEYTLTGEYGSGSRVYAAFECQYPQFPAPIRLGVARLTMP